jgi:hypothetical protein
MESESDLTKYKQYMRQDSNQTINEDFELPTGPVPQINCTSPWHSV